MPGCKGAQPLREVLQLSWGVSNTAGVGVKQQTQPQGEGFPEGFPKASSAPYWCSCACVRGDQRAEPQQQGQALPTSVPLALGIENLPRDLCGE